MTRDEIILKLVNGETVIGDDGYFQLNVETGEFIVGRKIIDEVLTWDDEAIGRFEKYFCIPEGTIKEIYGEREEAV